MIFLFVLSIIRMLAPLTKTQIRENIFQGEKHQSHNTNSLSFPNDRENKKIGTWWGRNRMDFRAGCKPQLHHLLSFEII